METKVGIFQEFLVTFSNLGKIIYTFSYVDCYSESIPFIRVHVFILILNYKILVLKGHISLLTEFGMQEWRLPGPSLRNLNCILNMEVKEIVVEPGGA